LVFWKKIEGLVRMFLNYINNLRGFVILLIVATHCLWAGLLVWPPMDNMFSVNGFLHTFILRSSGYFVFIAGFLFQYLSAKFIFSKYINTKFNNVILPYLLISIPAIAYDAFVKSDGVFNDYDPIVRVLLYYIHGMHMSYMWFIPMIVIFYFIAPLLIKLNQYPKLYWSLPIFVVISLVVHREVVPYHNPLQSFVHYFSIYVFGMWVSQYREMVLAWLEKYGWAILGLFLLSIFVQFYLRFILNLTFYMEMAAYFKIIFGSLLMVYLFRRYDHYLGTSLDKIAAMSFGIYFVHGYVLSALRIIVGKFSLAIHGNILTYLLLFLFTLISTLIILWIVKALFGKHSRKLVGY
jgi:surface polysaccharide O-acyltransferase-like enzyme